MNEKHIKKAQKMLAHDAMHKTQARSIDFTTIVKGCIFNLEMRMKDAKCISLIFSKRLF